MTALPRYYVQLSFGPGQTWLVVGSSLGYATRAEASAEAAQLYACKPRTCALRVKRIAPNEYRRTVSAVPKLGPPQLVKAR